MQKNEQKKNMSGRTVAEQKSPHAVCGSVPLSQVRWTGGFWGQRFDQCAHRPLPLLYDLGADPARGHLIENFRIAAGLSQGERNGSDWKDEWMYKWIEAGVSIHDVTRDETLAAHIDECIALVEKTQARDGYVTTHITKPEERYTSPYRHELYVMGHLITAACLDHRLRGTTRFLSIATKAADHIHAVFIPRSPKHAHFCINPSIIMACVDLYRETKAKKYLDLANCFIDMRGSAPKGEAQQQLPPEERTIPPHPSIGGPGGSDLNQTRIPLRDETVVVGHSVFWSYLYAGAADAYLESGDESLRTALERLWGDLVRSKMYVTGGVGALHHGFTVRKTAEGKYTSCDDVHEAVGHSYELTNATTQTYNETCSQIGVFLWAYRMLCMSGEARYAEIMEREMYNGFLSSLSADGESWFYINPLASHGKEQDVLAHNGTLVRNQPAATHTCCPTNMTRVIAAMHGYFYGVSDNGLWIHHYGSSTYAGSGIEIDQRTDYPWDGRVRITVRRAPSAKMRISLRIPEWAAKAMIKLNGVIQKGTLTPGTYCSITRTWKAGDSIELVMPMGVRLIAAHPKVESASNHAAVARGPIIYCLESPDLPKKIDLFRVHISRNAKFETHVEPKCLGGIVTVSTIATAGPSKDWDGALYQEMPRGMMKKIKVRLIPYYAWANRGISKMSIWLPLA